MSWLSIKEKTKTVHVLHIVDTNSYFQNAIFSKGQSSRHIWDAPVEAWSSVYIGYPRILKTDRCKAFTSADWKKLAEMTGMSVQISGNESHNSLGVGERYHDPLRRVFDTVCSEYPNLDPETAMRCAVEGIKNTMGSEGLVPSYSVLGTLPSFP